MIEKNGGTLSVTRDDRDWLLELGRQQGDSRILHSQTPSVRSLINQFRPDRSGGLSLPWNETDALVRFMPGKVTVWSGPTFSGKTALLRQLTLHAAAQGQPTFFASLEEEPDDVWRELICMACLTRTPSAAQVKAALDYFERRIYVFDSTELIDPDVLMGVIRYSVEKCSLKHIMIDSLMRLNLRTDDYDGQRELGNMLGRVARQSGAHIHLVVHPRKTANSRVAMDLYDIRGAQDIIAQADMVVTLERKHGENYDNLLTVWKQRGDANWIGEMRLYYHAASRQLLFSPMIPPLRYLPTTTHSDLDETQ